MNNAAKNYIDKLLNEKVTEEERKNLVEFSKKLKQWLKNKYPEINDLQVKLSISANPNPWITAISSGYKIPNELRLKILKEIHPELLSTAAGEKLDDVEYGNVSKYRLALKFDEWKKLLNETDINEETETKSYTTEEYIEKLDKTIKDIFPDFYVKVSNKSAIDNNSIHISVMIGKNKEEWINGIHNNDPLSQETIWIHDCIDDNGKIKNLISVENTYGGRLSLKDYSRIKLGWRNKTGSPEQILDYIKKYFLKVKEILKANKENIADIVKDKI